MKTRAWTVALMLLTTVAGLYAEDAPGDVYHVPKNRFEIPIRVDPSRQSNIKELQLYSSTDQGRTWGQVSSATPEQTAFPFAAQTDGEYWFIVVVIDQQNRREPPNPMKAPVGQKIVIDTLKPDVKVKADRKGDTVNVSWEIREENPNLNSFKLEWRPVDAPEAWVSVQASPSLLGRAMIRGNEAMVVRVTVEDKAKNSAFFETNVAASTGIITASASSSPPETVLPPTPPVTTIPVETLMGEPIKPPVKPAPTPPVTPMIEDVGVPSPMLPVEKPEIKPEIPVTGNPPATNVVAVTPPVNPAPVPTAPAPVPEVRSPFETQDTKLPTPPPTAPESPKAAQQELQIVNNRRVSMEYEVMKVGSSGVASVDLYVTRDDGLTWKDLRAEHSAAAGAEQTPGVMRRMLTVDLVEEGVYGFYMVVKSGAGLSLDPPKSTSQPQMRLKLDTKQPFAQLFKPTEDKKQPDSLLITWEASDENLDANPVTIEWAEKPGGPWEFIGAAQMPNSGSYSWKVPAGVPAKVYLRLTVRDKAGNVSVAETAQPQHIDFSKPVPMFKGVVIRNR